jgi:hypothetical protein
MKTIFTSGHKSLLSLLIFFSAVFIQSAQSFGQVCSDPLNVVYGMTNSGLIYPINVNTGVVGSVLTPAYTGNAPSSSNAIGYNSVNGNFYYFKRNYPSSPQEFVSFNPSTNAYTILASSPVTANVNSGCVSFDGTGYYCLDMNGNLCFYDIASNVWTLITSVYLDGNGVNVSSNFTTYPSGDMAIDGLGDIWIVCSGSSKYGMFKIHSPLPKTAVSNLTITQIIPITSMPSGANFAGIAFSPTGQIYMSTSSGDNQLYRLETNLTLTHMSTFNSDGVGADLTSCNYPFTLLPVSWENFTVELQSNKSVSVSWEVSQQMNNKGYYVERSADGANWDQLGFVASNRSLGTSENYSFTDNNPYSGKNYYRIQELDLDGNSNYSGIKTVSVVTVESQLSVWPNPAKDVISIQNNNDSYSIAKIYNQSGSLISENKLHTGVNTISISSLPFGAYIVNVKLANGQSFNQKFIKE